MPRKTAQLSRHFRQFPKRIILAASLAVMSALVANVCAVPNAEKCDAAVASQLSQARSHSMNVVVRFTHAISKAQMRELGLYGDVYRKLYIVNSAAMTVPTGKLRSLMDLPFVSHVSADESVRKTDQFTDSSSLANQAYSQYGLTGQGVGVAVLDSGVGQQADFNGANATLLGNILGLLTSRVLTQVTFVPGESANDLCGHGTHVAGIVAGNGESSNGLTAFQTYYGVARDANIVSVKVLNQYGEGTVSQVISGIQWCIAHKSTYNIKVINLSLGHPVGESYTQDPLDQAVEQAWKAGIVVVCAAGNDGRLNANATAGQPNGGYGTNYGSIECPGNDPYVITVGAMKLTDGTRADDQIATYSSQGPGVIDYALKPDVVAPGNQVISVEQSNSYLVSAYASTNQVPYSAYELSLSQSQSSNNYFRLSGTSMATPVVAAAAAMLLQKYPTLSPDTIKLRIMASADKWTDPYGNGDACTYGAGYIDIPAAYESKLVATGYAMSPYLSEDGNGNVFVQLNSSCFNQQIWGSGLTNLSSIYGSAAFEGNWSNILSASQAIWGNHALWGISVPPTASSIGGAGVDLSAGSISIQGEP